MHAVVICRDDGGWGTVNGNWRDYGSVPVKITVDYALCGRNLTLADLKASHADTLVLAGVASSYSFAPKAIQAIQTYAEEGHTLLGASLVFGYQPGGKDNDALAPVFGLAEQETWRKSGDSGAPFTFSLDESDPASPALFRDVPDPYVSSNAARTEKPTDSHWSANELAGARYLGLTSDTTSAITLYDSAGYRAIYIADTPYYASTPDDLQFLYNAIIYPRSG